MSAKISTTSKASESGKASRRQENLQSRSVEELQERVRNLAYGLQGMAVEGLELPKDAQEEFSAIEAELALRAKK